MPLYLVRHGEAHVKTFNTGSALTEGGRAAVDRLAHLLSAFAIPVSEINHSGKTRAWQTANIMGHYLKPSLGEKEIKGINPNDDVTEISKSLDPSKNIMMVSHLPFLERLVSYLVIDTADKTIIKFQSGGIVCLDKDAVMQSWYIKWALMPEMK
jgi:phosphohistidine phosphatase